MDYIAKEIIWSDIKHGICYGYLNGYDVATITQRDGVFDINFEGLLNGVYGIEAITLDNAKEQVKEVLNEVVLDFLDYIDKDKLVSFIRKKRIEML